MTVEKAGYLVSENEREPNLDADVEDINAAVEEVHDDVAHEPQEPAQAAADDGNSDEVPAAQAANEPDAVAVREPADVAAVVEGEELVDEVTGEVAGPEAT